MPIAVADSKIERGTTPLGSMNFAAGDCLVVFQSWDSGSALGVTDNNGNTYGTPVVQVGGSGVGLAAWVFGNQAANAALVVSGSSVGGDKITVALRVTGAATSPLDTDTPASNFTDAASAHTTTTAGTIDQANGLVLAALAPLAFTVVTWTASGFTKLQEEPDSNYYAMSVFSKVSAALSGTTSITSVPSTAADTTQAIFVLKEAAGGGPVSVALTGQALTAAQGALGRATARALTGSSVALSQGTLGKTRTRALTGQAATFAQGALAKAITRALGGQSASFAQGSVSVAGSSDVTAALTGLAISAAQGTLVGLNANPLTGVSVALSQGTLGRLVSRTLAGQAAAFASGVLTPVNAGGAPVEVALSGQSIGFAQGALAAAGGTPANPDTGGTGGIDPGEFVAHITQGIPRDTLRKKKSAVAQGVEDLAQAIASAAPVSTEARATVVPGSLQQDALARIAQFEAEQQQLMAAQLAQDVLAMQFQLTEKRRRDDEEAAILLLLS